MPRITFTPQLRRFVDAPDVFSDARTLRTALADAFLQHPRLRGYVLDDQGHLRANVALFIDGNRHADGRVLDVPLRADSTVHVLQALSGG